MEPPWEKDPWSISRDQEFDQHAYLFILIGVSSLRLYVHSIVHFIMAENGCPDQSAHVRRLIRASVIRLHVNGSFR